MEILSEAISSVPSAKKPIIPFLSIEEGFLNIISKEIFSVINSAVAVARPLAIALPSLKPSLFFATIVLAALFEAKSPDVALEVKDANALSVKPKLAPIPLATKDVITVSPIDIIPLYANAP